MSGAAPGRQIVGVEFMRAPCWRCGNLIHIASGYVVPVQPVSDWNAPNWLYWLHLPLAAVSDTARLRAAITEFRRDDLLITPVGDNFSAAAGGRYFSATCPVCSKLQGDHFVGERRFALLEGGVRGKDLFYRPALVEVTERDIEEAPIESSQWTPV